jgi:hypothetical protein
MRLLAALTLMTAGVALCAPASAAIFYRTVDCRKTEPQKLPQEAIILLRGNRCTALLPEDRQNRGPELGVKVLRGKQITILDLH